MRDLSGYACVVRADPAFVIGDQLVSHIPRSRDQSHALCWVDCLRVRHTMCVYTHSWCDPQWLPHISGSLPASPQHNMCWKGHTQSHAGYIVPLRRCRSVHGMCSMSCSLLTCRCSFQIMGHTARPESVLPPLFVMLRAGYSSTYGYTSTGAWHSVADLLCGPGESHVPGKQQ